MRIVCEKCSAAYAIDDRLITQRGVRAQCPRCRHLQLVTRESAAATTAPPQVTPVSTPAITPEALRGGPERSPAGPKQASIAPPIAPATAPGPAAPNVQSQQADPWSAPTEPGRMAPPPRPKAVPPAPPASPAPSASSARHASSAPPASSASSAPSASSASSAPPPSPAIEIDDALLSSQSDKEAVAGCRECGKPLTDAFDVALGVCDACREKADQSEKQAEEAQGAKPAAARRAPEAASSSAPPSFVGGRGRVPPPAPPVVKSATRPEAAKGGAGKWIALAAVLVVLGAGAGAAFVFRDRLLGQGGGEIQALPPAVADVLPAWRMAHVEVSGTSAEHVAEGRRLLREDRQPSYEAAVESFQKALILDPRNDDAIAGYARALASARGARLEDARFDETERLLAAAEKRSKAAPEVMLGLAQLLLTRPANAEQARAIAEDVVARSQDPLIDAEAHVVIGRSWQSTSSALAAESFTQAVTLDPENRVAWFQRALAEESSGELGAALADLEKRLQMDPAHWGSNAALARIYREAGRPELARQVYERMLEKDPEHHRARLALAVFQYQSGGEARAALTELRSLARGLDRFDVPDQVEILIHLATAERLAGNENAAVAAAQQALKLAPEDPAPHLQLLLVALERGVVTEGDKHLAALSGKLGDPGLEKLLEGRLRMAESRWPEAAAAFGESAAADPRRLDALLLAGVAWANAEQREPALKSLNQVARADPARRSPPPRDERFFFDPARLLRGTEERISKLGSSADDLLPSLYEGVLRYHLGEPSVTARLADQVTDRDTNNALALAWHSFALGAQGNARGAAQSGARAVAASRQLPLAHYAHGAALADSKKDEEARRALSEAIRLDPGLLGAEQKLAELDVRRKDVASARKRLVHIVTLDPSWLPAKQLLLSLEKENPREGSGPR